MWKAIARPHQSTNIFVSGKRLDNIMWVDTKQTTLTFLRTWLFTNIFSVAS